MNAEEKTEKLAERQIRRATLCAFLLAMNPVPQLDVVLLSWNEHRMIRKIATVYGCRMVAGEATKFLNTLDATVGDMWRERFTFLRKVGLAASITYAVGRSASAWFKSGRTLSPGELRSVYVAARGLEPVAQK